MLAQEPEVVELPWDPTLEVVCADCHRGFGEYVFEWHRAWRSDGAPMNVAQVWPRDKYVKQRDRDGFLKRLRRTPLQQVASVSEAPRGKLVYLGSDFYGARCGCDAQARHTGEELAFLAAVVLERGDRTVKF